MSGRRAVWEVARRELTERLRSRAWRISLVLLLVVAVGGAVAAARVASGTPTDDVGLVGARAAALAPAIRAEAAAADRQVRLHRLVSAAAAEQALRDDRIDVALVDGRRLSVLRSRTQPAVAMVQRAAAAQAVVARLQGAGLSRDQAVAALTPRPLPVAVLDAGARENQRTRDMVYLGVLVLYIAIITLGQMVAASVTEEKSSRVVELLLTTIAPRQLLSGKVLGIGALGLGQLTITGVGALLAGALAGGRGLPSAAPGTVALVLLWFVLGFAFYAVAFAAVGALVSRQEDLTTASLPLTAVLVSSFIIVTIVLEEPNGTFATIAAFVPFVAPLVVPARVLVGDMGALGLIATVAVQLLATAGLVVIAGRIYEQAILRIGAPVKLRSLIAEEPHDDRRRELALRGVAVVLVIAGGLTLGGSRALGLGLIAAGLALSAWQHHSRIGPRGT